MKDQENKTLKSEAEDQAVGCGDACDAGLATLSVDIKPVKKIRL